MSQKSVLALSAGITAFLLMFVAAFAIYIAQPGDTTGTIIPGQPPTAEVINLSPSQLDPHVQALIDGREAIYRQQLQQADAELRQANARLQQAYSQLEVLTSQPSPTATLMPTPAQPAHAPAPAAAVYAVSPGKAAAIALKLAPGASLTRPPELVDFQGNVAYEVQTSAGVAYIDANNSQVLYNGMEHPSVSSSTGPRTSSGRELGEQEHEDSEAGDD